MIVQLKIGTKIIIFFDKRVLICRFLIKNYLNGSFKQFQLFHVSKWASVRDGEAFFVGNGLPYATERHFL